MVSMTADICIKRHGGATKSRKGSKWQIWTTDQTILPATRKQRSTTKMVEHDDSDQRAKIIITSTITHRSILLPPSQPLITQPPSNASVLSSSSSSLTTDLDLRSEIYTKERKKNEEEGRFLYSCTIHCSVYIWNDVDWLSSSGNSYEDEA
ncbi:unnamed protein product [Lactuca virosa]|uniref:Uncharacterized protein n=1 Tax=Lactuca virosa TaxID=75947 RepID=A0AAU9MSS8_9ASTR|nr:unnamed protein product [Lactuca virosa]